MSPRVAFAFTTVLPSWAAPGTKLRRRGRTTPVTRVELWIGVRRRAATVSGPRGRFLLGGRVPRERADGVVGDDFRRARISGAQPRLVR